MWKDEANYYFSFLIITIKDWRHRLGWRAKMTFRSSRQSNKFNGTSDWKCRETLPGLFMKRTGFNVPSHGELSKPWQWLLNCWSFKTVNQCDLILHKRRTFDSKQGDKRRVNRKAISIEPSSDQKHNNSMNNWNAQETIVLKIDYPTLILWSIVNFIFFYVL